MDCWGGPFGNSGSLSLDRGIAVAVIAREEPASWLRRPWSLEKNPPREYLWQYRRCRRPESTSRSSCQARSVPERWRFSTETRGDCLSLRRAWVWDQMKRGVAVEGEWVWFCCFSVVEGEWGVAVADEKGWIGYRLAFGCFREYNKK